jgi:hypothetical protein
MNGSSTFQMKSVLQIQASMTGVALRRRVVFAISIIRVYDFKVRKKTR